MNSVSVALQHPDTNATLRYTLDGTLPTTSSFVYSGPIAVTNSLTLTAKAFESGFIDSVGASALFIINHAPVFVSDGLLSNNTFQVLLSATAGKSYVFQGSTDLFNWNPLSTNVAPSNIFNLLDPGAGGFRYRFYRAVELP